MNITTIVTLIVLVTTVVSPMTVDYEQRRREASAEIRDIQTILDEIGPSVNVPPEQRCTIRQEVADATGRPTILYLRGVCMRERGRIVCRHHQSVIVDPVDCEAYRIDPLEG